MERIDAFLPSVLTLACIAVATQIYLRLVIRHFGDNYKSVEWHRQNQWKVICMVSTPLINILAPAAEELIFRAPLIIAFSAMTSTAWYCVLASSTLFALIHWPGKKISMSEILFAREDGSYKSDNVKEETERLYREGGRNIVVRKVIHVLVVLPSGILFGYSGIRYQSIWVSVGIHSAWNLIMPIVMLLLTLFGALIYLGVSSLWDRVMARRRWRNERRRRK